MATPQRYLAQTAEQLAAAPPTPAFSPSRTWRATDLTVAGAFAYCRRVALLHAGAFPLSSRLPANLAPFFDAVFAFARTGNQIADGPEYALGREAALGDYREQLQRAFDGAAEHPIFVALARTIELFELPISAFEQMLDGFEADVRGQPFAAYAEFDRHCRLVAVPMGELVLRLFDVRDQTLRAGDALAIAVCQTDFWEDVAADARRGRIYIPAEDLRHFGVEPDDLRRAQTPACRELLRFEAMRTRALLERAQPLLRGMRGAVAVEMRLLHSATARRLRALVDGQGLPEPLPLARARAARWMAWARP